MIHIEYEHTGMDIHWPYNGCELYYYYYGYAFQVAVAFDNTFWYVNDTYFMFLHYFGLFMF